MLFVVYNLKRKNIPSNSNNITIIYQPINSRAQILNLDNSLLRIDHLYSIE